MKLNKFFALGAAVALAILPAASMAAGTFTPGFPTYPTTFLTGAEQIPADTLLAGGAAPQSVALTLNQVSAGAPALAVTAAAGAATANAPKVNVTTESLTTAAAASYTLVLTDSSITANTNLQVTIGNGTNTTPGATLATATPGAGTATIVIFNRNASVALNGTLQVFVRAL